MKSAYPYFGGKSRVASLVWERFGYVPNYIEPFFGSGAILLNRPHWNEKTRQWNDPTIDHYETINDINPYIPNFWRAMKYAPEEVYQHVQWPISEPDMEARHRWLVASDDLKENVLADPEFYDAKMAAWWVWGLCLWYGGDWGSNPNPRLPTLDDTGRGIMRKTLREPEALRDYVNKLHSRIANVRVTCGNWTRVVTSGILNMKTPVGVFLDPPYKAGGYDRKVYEGFTSEQTAEEVNQWVLEHANDDGVRIALCGYEGDYDIPDDWEVVEWKASGGYGNRRKGGYENKNRERIWFNPNCQRQLSLL